MNTMATFCNCPFDGMYGHLPECPSFTPTQSKASETAEGEEPRDGLLPCEACNDSRNRHHAYNGVGSSDGTFCHDCRCPRYEPTEHQHERRIATDGTPYDFCKHCWQYLEPSDFGDKPADHPDLVGEILPCPFCGNAAVKTFSCGAAEENCPRCSDLFGCNHCDVWQDTAEEWNRRQQAASPDAVIDEKLQTLARLGEKALERIRDAQCHPEYLREIAVEELRDIQEFKKTGTIRI